MENNNTQNPSSQSGEDSKSDRIIRTNEIGSFIKVKPSHQFPMVKADTLVPELKINNIDGYETGVIVSIPINEIVLTPIHQRMYNSSEKRHKIDELKESISICGQLQPIVIIKHDGKNYLLDGRLRQIAMIELDFQFISAIISPSVNDGDTLENLFIQYHIRKELSDNEKLNEIIELLQIGKKVPNKYIGSESRRRMLSLKLGKGFSETNLKKLEKVISFEIENQFDYIISKAIINNKLNINNAQTLLQVIQDTNYTSQYEKQHGVIQGLIDNKYILNDAVKQLQSATLKNKLIENNLSNKTLHPTNSENYEIRQGDIFEVDLSGDTYDVVFTSPPYLLQREYGSSMKEIGVEKNVDEYITNLVEIFQKVYLHLSERGSIFVNINDTWKDGFSLNVIEKFVVEMEKNGIHKVQMIHWEKPNPKPQGNNVHRYINKFEYIIHLAKSKNYIWNKIGKKKSNLLIHRHCAEVGRPNNGYSIPDLISACTNLISENMIEGLDGYIELTSSLKNNPNILKRKYIHGEDKHTATFNVLLPLLPLLSTLPRDRQGVVFDPFAGTSTTGETALALGHKFLGIELYENNCKTSARVLSQSEDKFRDLNLSDELFEPED